MNRMEQIHYLNHQLLQEMPEYQSQAARFPENLQQQRRLLRSLMNVRPPMPLKPEFLDVQNALLLAEQEEKGPVDGMGLPGILGNPRLALWRGDITRLAVDAIVNAGNSGLLGCFCPCHGCIDNAIHSAAGLELRDACSQIMQDQGHPEPVGRAKITKGYNLPARHVIHTVGPMIRDTVTDRDREALASCYRSCLELAKKQGLSSVAFCCISTGEFHFPNREAARIAVETVTGFLRQDTSIRRVVFNVFKDRDEAIYRELLGADKTA